MADAYRISGWERYEPETKNGKPYKGKVDFVKIKCLTGHTISAGLFDLHRFAEGEPLLGKTMSVPCVLGVFLKCLEIAGNVKGPVRDGTLYDNHGKPATAKFIARMLLCEEALVATAIDILISAEWIEKANQGERTFAKANQGSPILSLSLSSSLSSSSSQEEGGVGGDSSARPKRNHQPATHGPSGPTDSMIDEIFHAHPRPAKPETAKEAIRLAIRKVAMTRFPSESDPIVAAGQWLLGVTKRFQTSPAGKQGRYTASAAKWFEAGCYDEDPELWQRAGEDPPPKRFKVGGTQ